MADPVGPVIRVRAVRGRVVDPFRGCMDDGAQRLASRTAESQPLDDVVAALAAIAGVTLARAGRRFTLTRGTDTLKVAFASAAKRVSLDDISLEGDGALAINVMHALLPLFGAVELEIGRYGDLIDGHETLDAVAKRYDAWFIEDSLRVAKRMEARDAAARVQAASAGPVPAPRPRRVSNRLLLGIAVGFVAIVVISAVSVRTVHYRSYRAVGEQCTKSGQCEYGNCLPREPVESMVVSGIDMATLQRYQPPTDPTGVCTKTCGVDADCPPTMHCGDIISYGQLGIGSRARACIPREWDQSR